MGNSSPLRSAIRNDDVDKLHSELVNAGEGSPDMINEDYTGDCLCERTRNIQSPLHTCVAKRKPQMAELLLQYGADITSGGRSGMTALHYAAKNGDLPMCKLMVKYGADPSAEDNLGQKPIHSAAASCWAESNSNQDVLRYLIEEVGKPEDVHHQDMDSRTPLHVAAFWGYVGLAKYLLEKGADDQARSNTNKTPLDEARSMRKEAMVEFLSSNTNSHTNTGNSLNKPVSDSQTDDPDNQQSTEQENSSHLEINSNQ